VLVYQKQHAPDEPDSGRGVHDLLRLTQADGITTTTTPTTAIERKDAILLEKVKGRNGVLRLALRIT
jgi:hypothetical protein